MNFIECRALRFAYGEETGEVLHGVDLDIKKGEFVALLGHNGCGKSTMAKLFNGMLVPTAGTVYVDGIDTAVEDTQLDVRRRVGLVQQNPDNQLVAGIVEEDVAFGPENLGIAPAEIRRRVDDALTAVGMEKFTRHAPHLLSGGQKQRVAIAGVIAMRPDCLVLDEATAMLDPIGREKVMRTVHRLNDDYGITVVQITHYMEEAATADRVVVMSAGRVVMEGTPKEVFRNVEELRALHLDVPQAAELCHALTAAGCPMADDIIDVEECAAALYELLTGKKAPGAAQEKAEEVSACPQS